MGIVRERPRERINISGITTGFKGGKGIPAGTRVMSPGRRYSSGARWGMQYTDQYGQETTPRYGGGYRDPLTGMTYKGGTTTGRATGGGGYQDILDQFVKAMEEANKANEARYQEGLELWDKISGIYGPEGTYGAGTETMLGRAKTQDVAAGMQQMVSGGLYGTTVAAGLPKKWEEEVGMPARLQLEDIKSGRLGEAYAGKAGFIERRTDRAPDMGLFADLMMRASTAPTGSQEAAQFAGTATGRYTPSRQFTGQTPTAKSISMNLPMRGPAGRMPTSGGRYPGGRMPPAEGTGKKRPTYGLF